MILADAKTVEVETVSLFKIHSVENRHRILSFLTDWPKNVKATSGGRGMSSAGDTLFGSAAPGNSDRSETLCTHAQSYVKLTVVILILVRYVMSYTRRVLLNA